MKHRGGCLKPFGGKNLEDFGKKVCNLIFSFIEPKEPLIEEEKVVAWVDFLGV